MGVCLLLLRLVWRAPGDKGTHAKHATRAGGHWGSKGSRAGIPCTICCSPEQTRSATEGRKARRDEHGVIAGAQTRAAERQWERMRPREIRPLGQTAPTHN